MSEQRPSRIEQVLELLIEEIMDRMEARHKTASPTETEPPAIEDVSVPPPAAEAELAESRVEPEAREAEASVPEVEPGELPPPLTGPSHAARLMGRLALWLLIATVLINVPFNRHGVTLATAMPDAASFVIRDGFVVKEEDHAEIYVYQNHKFRWISSLDAFEHYGFTWKDVHIVPDGYLDRYESGSPIHVLLKCKASPHIYRLESGKKRWIRDIDTFVAEGHVWEDVRFVSCQYLGDLSDGKTIPPDSGPPPQP